MVHIIHFVLRVMTIWSWPINNIHLTGCWPSSTVRPTDRGSNDGLCWSTVVCFRGWVREVSIHGHRPRIVVWSTDRGSVRESGLSQIFWLSSGEVFCHEPRTCRTDRGSSYGPWMVPVSATCNTRNLQSGLFLDTGCYIISPLRTFVLEWRLN